MLALEQSSKKWAFSSGGGGHPTAPTPFGYGPTHRTGNGYTRGSGRVRNWNLRVGSGMKISLTRKALICPKVKFCNHLLKILSWSVKRFWLSGYCELRCAVYCNDLGVWKINLSGITHRSGPNLVHMDRWKSDLIMVCSFFLLILNFVKC